MNIESLFQKAFSRFKERFLSYVIVSALSWGLGVILVLIGLLMAGVIALVWFSTKAVVITAVLGVVAVAVLLVGLIYISAWIQLATVDVLISSKKLPPFDVYKKVKPLIGGYIYFMVVLGLFMIGLLPFTLVSLFIVGILWSLWSIFSVFVYLEKRKKGLENLWTSREMVNQKFWPILGVVLLVILLMTLVSIVLVSAKTGFAISLVSQLVLTPFIMSLYYETYLTLKAPAKVSKAPVWIVLSVIGYVITVLVLVVSVQALGKLGSDFMKKNNSDQKIYKELQYPSPTISG